jgi:hypothetical protein
MCPIFRHIISRKPKIGDYIVTLHSIGVIIDITDKVVKNKTCLRYYNIITNWDVNKTICYRDFSNEIILEDEYDITFVIITKELGDLITNTFSNDEFTKIQQIVFKQDGDNDSPTEYYIYMLLYRFHTYFNSIISDEVDKMILLSFGIKKVLKKHKNTGLRDVLLGNGQVWQLKKRKAKGILRRNIITTNRGIDRNESFKKKIKTVHYTVIKRLYEYENTVS